MSAKNASQVGVPKQRKHFQKRCGVTERVSRVQVHECAKDYERVEAPLAMGDSLRALEIKFAEIDARFAPLIKAV